MSTRSSTRARLVRAGIGLLQYAEADVLTSGLTVESIASRAGVSTQTFHNAFPGTSGGKREYIATLWKQLPVLSTWGLGNNQRSGIAATGGSSSYQLRSLRDFARELFDNWSTDEAVHIRRIVRVIAPDDRSVALNVRRGYQDLEVQLAAHLPTIIESLGSGRFKQPFTSAKVATAIIALAEGFEIRRHFDHSVTEREAFADVVVALLSSVADRGDNFGHIDDVDLVTTIDQSEYVNDSAGALPDDPERAVIDAAVAEFAQRGYFSTTQSHIARRAGLDTALLRRMFPSNVDIIVAGLTPVLTLLTRRIEMDTRVGRSPQEVIAAFPRRMAEQIIEKRSLFDAMALVLSLHGAQAQVDATRIRDELYFPGAISGCIAAGQRSGHITDVLDAEDLAVTLTNNLIFRCLSRRSDSADEVSGAIARLFLPALFTVTSGADAVSNVDDEIA